MKIGWLWLACAVLIGSACGSNGPVSDSAQSTSTDVVLLGVVKKTGLTVPVSASVMAADLAGLIASRGDVIATSVADTRQIIGGSPHDEMLAFFARNARFAPYQVQRLMAADLPSRRALAVRLDSDRIDRLPVRRQGLIDAWGRRIADRERRTFVTRRVTRMSATMLDLRNGRVIWTRQYRVTPESESASNHYTGGSFGASVAAAVANTMLDGIRENDYPAPPSLNDSVLALLQEVAYNAPLR